MSTAPLYPVHVSGTLEPRLSRWLWLVKWLLAIPHFIVLVFLWIAFFVVSVIAWFAILITGRYPPSLFEFNLGVLRWSWRVAFYSYGALGTDRYPPFTLGAAPDYPATLEIDYPEHLSRGLALVKWWLLALPHYLVVGIFVGGGAWVAWSEGPWRFAGGPGLIGLLVLIAAVVLLFAGRYPRSVFDFVLGLNRWVIRVAAYAGLMTDRYPPFRLDMGDVEPGTVELTRTPPAEAPSAPARTARWTAGSVVLVVLGTLAAFFGAVLLLGGAAAVVLDQTQRDSQGFLMSPTETFSNGSYAIVSETIDISLDGPDWVASSLFGTVKIETDAAQPVFVGIARESDAEGYLGAVNRAIVTDLGPDPAYDMQAGDAPLTAPAEQPFWVASASGVGSQALTWDAESGDWAIVLMNADGSAGVTAEAAIGAEFDALLWIGIGVLIGGALAVALAGLGIASGVRRARR